MPPIVWEDERNFAARLEWFNPPTYCPQRLITLLKRPKHGMTTILQQSDPSQHKNLVTLTVISGGAKERTFAQHTLAPIIMWIVRYLTNPGSSRIVHVTYCDACGARSLPRTRGDVLTCDHVNGGMCMGEKMGVLVFRKQDSTKVLVHELLHLYDMDVHLRNLPSKVEQTLVRSCDGLWRGYHGKLPVGLNEAYTDAIACLIFCGDDADRATNHAVHMATKVLAHFRFGRLPFMEATHAFAYYVIKAAVLVHSETFIKLIHSVGDRRFDPSIMIKFMDDCLHSRKFKLRIQNEARMFDSFKIVDMGIEMTDGKPNLILHQDSI